MIKRLSIGDPHGSSLSNLRKQQNVEFSTTLRLKRNIKSPISEFPDNRTDLFDENKENDNLNSRQNLRRASVNNYS